MWVDRRRNKFPIFSPRRRREEGRVTVRVRGHDESGDRDEIFSKTNETTCVGSDPGQKDGGGRDGHGGGQEVHVGGSSDVPCQCSFQVTIVPKGCGISFKVTTIIPLVGDWDPFSRET